MVWVCCGFLLVCMIVIGIRVEWGFIICESVVCCKVEMGFIKCCWRFLFFVLRYLGVEGLFGRIVVWDIGLYVRGNMFGKVV